MSYYREFQEDLRRLHAGVASTDEITRMGPHLAAHGLMRQMTGTVYSLPAPFPSYRAPAPSPSYRAPSPPRRPAEPPRIPSAARTATSTSLRDTRSGGGGGGGGGGSGGAGSGSEKPRVREVAVAAPISPSISASLTQIPYSALRFEDKLGEGGFGVVFKGVWGHAPVAIKQLKLHRLSGSALEEFGHETTVMFGLRHPNIVQLFAVCVEPGRVCMVMEYMPKGSLFQVLHDPKEVLGWGTKYQIATKIAGALAVLHEKGIIHRDLKSPNVLLDKEYQPKITDFGLARVKTETTSTSTASGSQGTVSWMAPECFKRGGKITSKADIFSFGMLLWELVTRKLPYEGAAAPAIVIHWITSGEKETIPEETPAGLKKMIQDCWETEPSRRPTATVIFETLKGLSSTECSAEARRPPGPKTAAVMRMAKVLDCVADRVAGIEAMHIAGAGAAEH